MADCHSYGESEDANQEGRKDKDNDSSWKVSHPFFPLRAVHRIAFRPELNDEKTHDSNGESPGIEGMNMFYDGADHAEKVSRHFAHGQPEKILCLLQTDHDRNAVRKTDHDRNRNELDEAADLEETHEKENDPRADRGNHEVGEAVLRDDSVNDDDEGASRATDLYTTSAEQGDEKTGNDCRIKAGFRRHSRGDAERHGQRQSHHADGEAGGNVAAKQMGVVAA